MPPSADVRDRARAAIVALERACLEADTALLERRWDRVSASFARQADLTAVLERLFLDAPEIAPANDAQVAQRVQGIIAYRGDQLRRLTAYRDEVGRRLDVIGKANAFARSFGRAPQPARLLDAQF